VACRRLAGPDGLCYLCRRDIEHELRATSPVQDFLHGLFGVGRVTRQQAAAAGAQIIGHLIEQRLPGIGHMAGIPAPGAPPPPRGPAPGGAQRPPPRAAPPRGPAPMNPDLIAARGTLGFGVSDVLTEKVIRERRRKLTELYHTDGHQPDATRTEMMKRLNIAADLLIKAAKPG
jgi:hypothetical protein